MLTTCGRVGIALALLLLATSCGGDATSGDSGAATTAPAGNVDQTVEIRMVDIAFKPDAVTVKAGTTVRFVFKNDGDLDHEAAFGDEATQTAVESGKQKREGIAASPNQTKDYVRRFDTPGSFLIGCHVAGHYAAGMKVRLTIT